MESSVRAEFLNLICIINWGSGFQKSVNS